MKPLKNRPCHAEADKMISFLLRKMPSEKPGGHNGKLENIQVFFCSFFWSSKIFPIRTQEATDGPNPLRAKYKNLEKAWVHL